MPGVRPIETKYAGCRFRSRLEARWAVFFDHAGIKWEYEPEGYTTSDGTCYIPDFYLPFQRIFIEVKPEVEQRRAELDKAVRFVSKSDRVLIILSTLPDPREGATFWYPTLHYSTLGRCVKMTYAPLVSDLWQAHGDNAEWETVVIFVLDYHWYDGLYGRMEDTPYNDRHLYGAWGHGGWAAISDDRIRENAQLCARDDLSDGLIRNVDEDLLKECYRAARSARFEFGECG